MLSLTVAPGLLLRTYREEDAAELFATVDKNRTHLRPWLIWIDATIKEAHSLDYIRAARQEQYDQLSMALGIFKQDKLIGGLGMHQWDQRLKKVQLGYWLSRNEEGKGIMSQCAAVFIQYLFAQLKLNKVELQYLPANTRSAAVAKRLGFVTEGVLRDHFLMNGILHNVVITGLLQREWKERASDFIHG